MELEKNENRSATPPTEKMLKEPDKPDPLVTVQMPAPASATPPQDKKSADEPEMVTAPMGSPPKSPTKDQKGQKDQNEQKEAKKAPSRSQFKEEQKENAENKEAKDVKEAKDGKDSNEPKEVKDQKDASKIKEAKDVGKEQVAAELQPTPQPTPKKSDAKLAIVANDLATNGGDTDTDTGTGMGVDGGAACVEAAIQRLVIPGTAPIAAGPADEDLISTDVCFKEAPSKVQRKPIGQKSQAKLVVEKSEKKPKPLATKSQTINVIGGTPKHQNVSANAVSVLSKIQSERKKTSMKSSVKKGKGKSPSESSLGARLRRGSKNISNKIKKYKKKFEGFVSRKSDSAEDRFPRDGMDAAADDDDDGEEDTTDAVYTDMSHRPELVLVRTNPNNGGRIFKEGKPFWKEKEKAGEKPKVTRPMISAVMFQMLEKKLRIRPAQPAPPSEQLDAMDELSVMANRDRQYFGEDIVLANTIFSIIGSLEMGEEIKQQMKLCPPTPYVLRTLNIVQPRTASIYNRYRLNAAKKEVPFKKSKPAKIEKKRAKAVLKSSSSHSSNSSSQSVSLSREVIKKSKSSTARKK